MVHMESKSWGDNSYNTPMVLHTVGAHISMKLWGFKVVMMYL